MIARVNCCWSLEASSGQGKGYDDKMGPAERYLVFSQTYLWICSPSAVGCFLLRIASWRNLKRADSLWVVPTWIKCPSRAELRLCCDSRCIQHRLWAVDSHQLSLARRWMTLSVQYCSCSSTIPAGWANRNSNLMRVVLHLWVSNQESANDSANHSLSYFQVIDSLICLFHSGFASLWFYLRASSSWGFECLAAQERVEGFVFSQRSSRSLTRLSICLLCACSVWVSLLSSFLCLSSTPLTYL